MHNIGIIGLGYWGKILAKRILENNIFNIAWTCDRSKEGLNMIPHSASYKNMPPVDAVMVATQPSQHVEMALYFLKKGVDVFLEKPMALSSVDCQKLLACALENKKTLFVDHTFMYTNCYKRLRSEIENQKIISINACRRNTKKNKNDTDPLTTLNYHDVYLISSLIGNNFQNLPFEARISENHCQINFCKDIEISISGSYDAQSKIRSFSVNTIDSYYFWDQLNGKLFKEKEMIAEENSETLINVLSAFRDSIHKRHISSANLGVQSIKLIETWANGKL